MSFEDALRALEDVVRKLESGEVPLDQSITLYERGNGCMARSMNGRALPQHEVLIGQRGQRAKRFYRRDHHGQRAASRQPSAVLQ